MQVHGFPVRIISRIESPAVLVELVAEHELELCGAVVWRSDGVSGFGGVLIDETPVPCKTLL